MNDTDLTSPWWEFLSYCRCCESLEIKPSIQKFMNYQKYLKTIGIIV